MFRFLMAFKNVIPSKAKKIIPMKYITIRPIKGWFSNKINIDKIISNIPNKIIKPAIYSKRKGKSTCKINKVIPPASKIIPASNVRKNYLKIYQLYFEFLAD